MSKILKWRSESWTPGGRTFQAKETARAKALPTHGGGAQPIHSGSKELLWLEQCWGEEAAGRRGPTASVRTSAYALTWEPLEG